MLGSWPIFIIGPTAVGKTRVAIEVALRTDAEIISVDSMQVYRGLETLTAAPTGAEQSDVTHHLVGYVEPHEVVDVARFLRDAIAARDSIEARGKRALFCGGTLFYIKALWDGLSLLPGRDEAVRARLQAQAISLGSAWLHRELERTDPPTAARLHPNDTKRIVRALEVALVSGRPMSSWIETPRDAPPVPRFTALALVLPRAELYARIDARSRRILEQGAVDEVRTYLGAAGGSIGTARQVLGMSPIRALLEDTITPAQALEWLSRDTRHLARRQISALRKDPRVVPLLAGDDPVATAQAITVIDRWVRGSWDQT